MLRIASASLLLCLLPLAGCNELTSSVRGQVKIDGKPLKLTDRQRGTVVFRPVAGGATSTSLINRQGRFIVKTGTSGGVKPGDYLVAVRVLEIIPDQSGQSAPSGQPITPALYGDPLESGLQYVIAVGENEIEIDLDSKAGPAVLPPPDPPEGVEDEADNAAPVENDPKRDAESETPNGRGASDPLAEAESKTPARKGASVDE